MFDVGNQQTWIGFQIKLQEGKHYLYARTILGSTTFSTELQMNGNRWAVLEYFYYPNNPPHSYYTPKQFNLEIQDRPIGLAFVIPILSIADMFAK